MIFTIAKRDLDRLLAPLCLSGTEGILELEAADENTLTAISKCGHLYQTCSMPARIRQSDTAVIRFKPGDAAAITKSIRSREVDFEPLSSTNAAFFIAGSDEGYELELLAESFNVEIPDVSCCTDQPGERISGLKQILRNVAFTEVPLLQGVSASIHEGACVLFTATPKCIMKSVWAVGQKGMSDALFPAPSLRQMSMSAKTGKTRSFQAGCTQTGDGLPVLMCHDGAGLMWVIGEKAEVPDFDALLKLKKSGVVRMKTGDLTEMFNFPVTRLKTPYIQFKAKGQMARCRLYTGTEVLERCERCQGDLNDDIYLPAADIKKGIGLLADQPQINLIEMEKQAVILCGATADLYCAVGKVLPGDSDKEIFQKTV